MEGMNIQGEAVTIGGLLNQFLFEVPVYQRPYSWKEKEVVELYDDLSDAFSSTSGRIDSVEPYFLGSAVFLEKEKSDKLEIIDGQQRLVTIAILLACIRHVRPTLRDRVNALLYADFKNGGSRRSRIRIRERENAFFERDILGEELLLKTIEDEKRSLSSSWKLMVDAARIFIKRLKEDDDKEEDKNASEKMLDVLDKRCAMVAIRTRNVDAAYHIFVTLNARGLELRSTDILKAMVIGRINSQDRRNFYTNIWEDAEKLLGADEFEALFRHLAVLYGDGRRVRRVVTDFERRVLPSHKEPCRLVEEVIRPHAAAVWEILNADYGKNKDLFDHTTETETVNSVFHRLKRYKSQEWVPVALACLRHYKELPTLIELVERLVLGLSILEISSEKRFARFGKVIKELREADVGEVNRVLRRNSPLRLDLEEREKIKRRISGPLYKRKRSMAYYMLCWLEEDYSKSRLPELESGKKPQIEHVLPQGPGMSSGWSKIFDIEKREEWTHRLANLVLLPPGINRSASNKDFAAKKESYLGSKKGSPYSRSVKEVFSKKKWDEKALKERQKSIEIKLNELMGLDPDLPIEKPFNICSWKLEYDRKREVWIDEREKLELLLVNGHEAVYRKDWDGLAMVVIGTERLQEGIMLNELREAGFKDVEKLIVLPMKMKVANVEFSYLREPENNCWVDSVDSEASQYVIPLWEGEDCYVEYWNGKELAVVAEEAEAVKNEIKQLEFFKGVTDWILLPSNIMVGGKKLQFHCSEEGDAFWKSTVEGDEIQIWLGDEEKIEPWEWSEEPVTIVAPSKNRKKIQRDLMKIPFFKKAKEWVEKDPEKLAGEVD